MSDDFEQAVSRWGDKLADRYMAQEPRTGIHDPLRIAAIMLAEGERREEKLAEAAATGIREEVVVCFPCTGLVHCYVARWDGLRGVYVTRDPPMEAHKLGRDTDAMIASTSPRGTCARNRQCALRDGHGGDCIVTGCA